MVVADGSVTLSLVDMYKRCALKSCGTDLLSQMMVKSWTSRLVRFIPPCLYISAAVASEPAAFQLVSFFIA